MLWVKDCRNFGRTGGWLAETWVQWPDGLRQLIGVEHVVEARAS